MDRVDTNTDARSTQPRGIPSIRTAWLPDAICDLVHALDRDPTASGLSRFQTSLAPALGATDVLCVWMDWPRRIAWSIAGPVSARLQHIIPDVCGSGRRTVVANAIIEPVGPAPTRSAILVKGPGEQVLQPSTVRTIARIAARIGPALDRISAE